MGILLIALVIFGYDDCIINQSCTTTTFELFYQGNVVSFGDMSAEECADLKTEIEKQTPAFTSLECREVPVARTQI